MIRSKKVIQVDLKATTAALKFKAEKLAKLPEGDMNGPALQAEIDLIKKDLAVYDAELEALIVQAKEQKEKEKDAQSKAYKADRASQFKDIIEKYDICHTMRDQQYYYKQHNKIHHTNIEGLNRAFFRFESNEERNELHTLIDAMGRNKSDKTFSFNKVDGDVLNLADGVREKWLKPKKFEGSLQDYKTPSAIDIMLTSLSAGDLKTRLHIEEAIVRKYRKPDDYRLPTLFMYGQGGVGKNEFVSELLEVIFKHSTAVTTFEVLTKNAFMLLGKVVVVLDETMEDKASYNKFKTIAGNPTILLKQLYVDVYPIDNVMWLIVASNSSTGPMSVGDDSTTRRFSPISYTRDLFDWLGDHIGKPYNKTDKIQQQLFTEAWRELKKQDFTNDKVAEWLGYLEAKFPLDRAVTALHSEAYSQMINAHKGPMESLIDDVLVADYENKPTAWKLKDLFQIYIAIARFEFSGRRPLGYRKWLQTIVATIARDRVDWYYDERKYWKINGKQNSTAILFKQELLDSTITEVGDLSNYLTYADNGMLTGLNDWMVESADNADYFVAKSVAKSDIDTDSGENLQDAQSRQNKLLDRV